MKAIKLMLFLILSMVWATASYAIEPISEKSGFSGFFSLGGGVVNIKTNMIAGNGMIDFCDETINSLGSPDSESKFVPAANFELKYTFSDTKTQLFLGNALEDLLTFDLATQAGVRQDMGGMGIMAGSFVFNGIPTEVWEDPYRMNTKRKATDRTSTGFRFTWDKIFRTGFQWQSTYRKIELDNERSGASLGLTASQMALLERNGDFFQNVISYQFRIAQGQFFLPSVTYIKNDLDGDAMNSDEVRIQLSYLHTVGRYNFVFNGVWGKADYDRRNPIFNRTREDDLLGVAGIAFYHLPNYKPLGCTSFRLWGNAAYYESDSNISFYETIVSSISAGVILYY